VSRVTQVTAGGTRVTLPVGGCGMRVLVATTSAFGHVLPVVPLARAIRDAGHELLWATGSDGCGLVSAAGLPAEVAGMSEADLVPVRKELRERAPARPEELAAFMFPNMFAAVRAPRMLDDLLPLARRWRPDVIVHEQGELASPLAAALIGVPSVTHGFGTAIPPPIVAAAAERVAPLWEAHQVEMPPYAGCFASPYLDPYPPSMQAGGAAHIPVVQLIRPVPYTGEVPAALPPIVVRDDRPLLYLTLGTVNNDSAVFQRLLAPLSDLPIRLLVTVGPTGDPAALGPQPAHVAVERFVSQTAVLPHCDAVVSHAGSGTVLGALALGLPQVCLPQAADQFRNSEAVARTGSGVVLRPDAVTPGSLVAAVQAVLGANAYRQRAAETAAEIAAMPAPDEVVPVLEAIAGS